MRIQKGLMSVLLVLTLTRMSYARITEFIDDSLEGFMDRMITQEEDKNLFKHFFVRLGKKYTSLSKEKKRAIRKYLYNLSWKNLEKEHEEWFTEVQQFFVDSQITVDETYDHTRNYIRRFLIWHGAYQEYLRVKGMAEQRIEEQNVVIARAEETPEQSVQEDALCEQEQEPISSTGMGGIWNTVRQYTAHIKNSIVGWFETVRNTLVM